MKPINIYGLSEISLFTFFRSLMTVISELLSTTYSTKSFFHSTAHPHHHQSQLQQFHPGKGPPINYVIQYFTPPVFIPWGNTKGKTLPRLTVLRSLRTAPKSFFLLKPILLSTAVFPNLLEVEENLQ